MPRERIHPHETMIAVVVTSDDPVYEAAALKLVESVLRKGTLPKNADGTFQSPRLWKCRTMTRVLGAHQRWATVGRNAPKAKTKAKSKPKPKAKPAKSKAKGNGKGRAPKPPTARLKRIVAGKPVRPLKPAPKTKPKRVRAPKPKVVTPVLPIAADPPAPQAV